MYAAEELSDAVDLARTGGSGAGSGSGCNSAAGFGAGRFIPLTKMGPWANRGEICFCFGAYLLGAFSEEAIGPFGFICIELVVL